jgi:hypothetical protein
MHDYDKCSKWLLQHHAGSILRLAGVQDVASWKPLQAELVVAKRIPDGLLEVYHRGELEPVPYIVEIATYPETRVAEQILDDTAAFRLVHRILPEVVVLFLHPKGKIEAAGSAEIRSRRGFTSWNVGWRAIRLWEVPAADLLAAGDIGLIPWVPLAKFDGPPEPIFRECHARIERDVPDKADQESLLVVTHLLAGLKYDGLELFELLGGRQIMVEIVSPVLREVVEFHVEKRLKEIASNRVRAMVVRILRRRFGADAEPIAPRLDAIDDVARLEELEELAATCADLDEFRTQLPG